VFGWFSDSILSLWVPTLSCKVKWGAILGNFPGL
jgi:hypothetical protein